MLSKICSPPGYYPWERLSYYDSCQQYNACGVAKNNTRCHILLSLNIYCSIYFNILFYDLIQIDILLLIITEYYIHNTLEACKKKEKKKCNSINICFRLNLQLNALLNMDASSILSKTCSLCTLQNYYSSKGKLNEI